MGRATYIQYIYYTCTGLGTVHKATPQHCMQRHSHVQKVIILMKPTLDYRLKLQNVTFLFCYPLN